MPNNFASIDEFYIFLSRDNKNFVKIDTNWKNGYYWWILTSLDVFDFIELMELVNVIFLGNLDDKAIDKEYVFNQLLSFLSPNDKQENLEEKDKKEKTFCPIVDYNRLWASFYEKFNIDIEKEKIHWHKFLMMFEIVLSSTNIAKIIEFRSYSPSKDDSNDYKKAMLDLKEKYSLKSSSEDKLIKMHEFNKLKRIMRRSMKKVNK